jgi:hypothetical protein
VTEGGSSGDRFGATPAAPPLSAASRYGFVHVRPTGNRLLRGPGDVRTAEPIDLSVEGTPAWVVGLPAPDGAGSHWTVVAADGTATGYLVNDDRVESVGSMGSLPRGAPPLVGSVDGRVLLASPADDAAAFTHPVPAGRGVATVDGPEDRGPSRSLYVGSGGDLVARSDDAEATRLPLDALPDGRLVRVSTDRYALLTDRTDRYRHGALGDDLEGGSLSVLDTSAETPRVLACRSVGPPDVIEGVKPIVADVDGDGEPELLVTLATSGAGARLAAFDPDGRRVAAGPPIGSGGWRHQLAVAPFGPDGAVEVAAVRKPHVEHRLEFARYRAGELSVVAALDGFRTHTYGSINPDGALAGDLDADGRVELLAPETARRRLAAVRRTEAGATVAWTLSLDGPLSTNVGGVALSDGRVAVAAGWDGTVRVWQG